jgi:hypothetical protein
MTPRGVIENLRARRLPLPRRILTPARDRAKRCPRELRGNGAGTGNDGILRSVHRTGSLTAKRSHGEEFDRGSAASPTRGDPVTKVDPDEVLKAVLVTCYGGLLVSDYYAGAVCGVT